MFGQSIGIVTVVFLEKEKILMSGQGQWGDEN